MVFDNRCKSRHCNLTARISLQDVSSAPCFLLSVSLRSSQNIFHMTYFRVAPFPSVSMAGGYSSCLSIYDCSMLYNKDCYFLLGQAPDLVLFPQAFSLPWLKPMLMHSSQLFPLQIHSFICAGVNPAEIGCSLISRGNHTGRTRSFCWDSVNIILYTAALDLRNYFPTMDCLLGLRTISLQTHSQLNVSQIDF